MEYQIVSNVAEKTSLFIEDDMTVGEVRTILGLMLDVPEQVGLVITYNGKLLKQDEDRWGDIAPRPSASGTGASVPRKLYCNVTGKPKLEPASSEAIRAVIPGKEQTIEEERAERARARAMEPMVEAMANNPQMLSAMLTSQPGLKKLMESNPEVAKQMKDPETLRTMMMSQLDPDRRREMGRNMELAMSQISNYPGGQQMFERYLNGFLRDQEGSADFDDDEDDDTGATRGAHGTSEESGERTSAPIPNPWQQPQQQTHAAASGPQGLFGNGMGFPMGMNPFASMSAAAPGTGPAAGSDGDSPFTMNPAMMQQMLQLMSGMGGAGQTPPLSGSATATTEGQQRDLTEQLTTLRAMGFENEALCREALVACNGDVEAAVEYLAERQE